MAKKYEIITQLYRRTVKSLASPQEWQRFLATACRNFRLPFDEQVLLYAQRPDATAVLPIEGKSGWNERFGRWVNRGATGIAVFDGESADRTRLKYYFDISDTHSSRASRPVPIWEMREGDQADMVEALSNSFGELENAVDFASALLSAAKNAVEDHMSDYLDELYGYTQGSFLEDLDSLTVQVQYRTLLENSVGYMLLARCGMDAAAYLTDDDFRGVTDFNTPQALNALGVATGDIGQMCMSELSRTALRLRRQEARENRTVADGDKTRYDMGTPETKQTERSMENGTDHIHQAGRLQSAEPAAAPGAGGSPWEVRIAAAEVSEREPAGDVHEPADNRPTEPAPDGDRADGTLPDGADLGADGERGGRDGAAESGGPDALDGADEQHPAGSGGDSAGGADLQLTGNEKGDSAELPPFLDETLILAAIANGNDGLNYNKQQIEMFFSAHADEMERAEYLRSAYRNRVSELFVDGRRVGYQPQEDGLLMWEGAYSSRTSESVFSWGVVAEWTAQLIETREYFVHTRFQPTKSQGLQQFSFFGLSSREAPARTEETPPALPQQVIDEAMCIGANDRHSRLTICAYFMKDKPVEDNAAFLRSHYGTNGAGFYVDGRQYALWYSPEGIRIANGDSALVQSAAHISWRQAAERIRELLDSGQYLPQDELERVADYERDTLADSLVLTVRDMTEEAREAGCAPTIHLALSSEGGYPESMAQVSALLADPEMLQKITEEWEAFTAAYEQNPRLMRFRRPNPADFTEKLRDLQREPVIFTAAEDYAPKRELFISLDEIDRVLRGSEQNTNNRLGVYGFFAAHHDAKERERYLKRVHGEYSGYHGGNDSITYTSKGLSFSHGRISEPYAQAELSWPQITRRIAAMIADGRFLSDRDREVMPEYELRQLAQTVTGFFDNAPAEHPKPFSQNPAGSHWEAVTEVVNQLSDPARVEEIYQGMMLPLWESTPRDDRMYDSRRAGLEAMQAYRAGTYSVFGTGKTLRPLPALTEPAESVPAPVPPTEKEQREADAGQQHLAAEDDVDPDERFQVVEVDWYGSRPAYAIWDDIQDDYYVDEAGVTVDFLSEWEAETYLEQLREKAVHAEPKATADDFSDIDPAAVREQLAEHGIVNGEVVDEAKLTQSPFIQQVAADAARMAAGEEIPFVPEPRTSPWGIVQQCVRLNHAAFQVSAAGHGGVMVAEEAARRMLTPEALEISKSPEDGFYSFEEDAEMSVPLLELYNSGQMDKGAYFSRLIPRAGESREQMEARWLELTQEEVKTFYPEYFAKYWQEGLETQAVEEQRDVHRKSEEDSAFPYAAGDTVYLEDSKPFIIEQIGLSDIQLRDSSQTYPILRAESRENFLRLMERYPQDRQASQAVTEETAAFYPAEENKLPFDVEIRTMRFGEPEQVRPEPEAPAPPPRNFHITDDHLGEGGAKAKFRMNMEAIALLKELEAADRQATPEEQEVLSRYVGWGGLPNAFDAGKDGWQKEYDQLKQSLTPEEYAAARASTLNAHYTSPTVIKAIYEAVAQMGFQTGNILEPSMGVGNFFGLLPDSMAGSKLYGVELDSITGRIAKQLYPNADITVAGFETTDRRDFFDLAVGNVPFGSYKVNDKAYDKLNFTIHNYFFAKALDQVRPGGLVAFVTSHYTMDAKDPSVRKYLAQRAELLGAIRLPNNAFRANAGTEVTSDILFLQRRERPVDIDAGWIHLGQTPEGLPVNSYFANHPEMVLGTIAVDKRMYGSEEIVCQPFPNADLSAQLQEAIRHISGVYRQAEPPELGEDEAEDSSIPADPDVRNFSFTLRDDTVYYRENSRMYPVNVSATAGSRIRGMIALRDCVRQLIEYQAENYPDSDIAQVQARLNELYDSYTQKYGLLTSRGNRLVFGEDASYCLLCSLEVLDEDGNLKRKADMFSKRTIRPHEAVTSVDTASEALAVSISEKARVDMAYMSALSGKTEEELEAELTGVIFRDIVCGETPGDIPAAFVDVDRFPLVTADEYLSGNVRRKLRMAKALREVLPAEKKNRIAENITALEAVQPADLTAAEIGVRIGANWVPIEIYQQFMVETFGTSPYARSRIRILRSEATGQWAITEKNADRGNVKSFTTYGTKRMNAYNILEQSLNQKDVRVFDYVEDAEGRKKPVLNKKETAIAQDRQELIRQQFAGWIWSDIDRREQLCGIYNETFNAIRPREYDGQHIRFPGMNPEITLRPHQVNAIAHILYGGNTLLAHEVGAGKTYEIVAAAMEMKRLGLCTKSLVVVPNHITEQWAAEWLQLYPSANILVATRKDFERQNRRKFCARIATGDYDAVIIGHSQFEKIPMSTERQITLLQQQIDDIMSGIESAKAAKAERYTIKQLEKTRRSLEQKLQRLNDQSRKDDIVTFEELGVDRLFVDESHFFKNLFLATKMRNVGGIAQTEAQKSSDLFMKCRYLDEITGGKGTVFATGTPISNSMVELYTIQRYLQYSTLEEMGLLHFDDWASDFGETVTAIELSPEGSGYRAKTRFARFFNLPELMAAFKQVADIQTADMLKLPVPKANFHTEVITPSELQKEMVAALADRAEVIRGGGVDPKTDNMLKITNDGRKLALDMRLINPLAADDPKGKVAVCAGHVARIWEQTKDRRSAQLVFCDLSTPKSDGTFSVYNDLKSKLMAAGIPEEEIAFIHDANTEARKKELFAKVRAGQVRILMGSTQKMGAGTNVQDRLIALHDLDCPWRPSDLSQRLGRIVRQGNENPEVEIYRYVTEGTFDAYLYQLVENKQKFIAQIMTSKAPVRVADDVDETALSYSEIKALATGNPLIIEKCNLDMEVSKLNLLKANYLSQRYSLEGMVLRKYPEDIRRLTERIAGYEKDVTLAAEHPKLREGFVGMEILGAAYTEKEGAGKAIIDACTKMTGSDAVFLGQYRGFSLTLSYDGMSSEYRMTLKGTLSHTVALGADVFGNITRIDNLLDSLPTRLETTRQELAEAQAQLENARGELNQPFAREAELAEKSARLKELNILLNMDQKDKTLLDDVPEEDSPEMAKSREHVR